MHPHPPDRPYLTSWLRRTRRQLSTSGRLSELALILSRLQGNTPAHWSGWLREVLENEIIPSLDELTAIDALLARPRSERSAPEAPMLL